MRPPGIPAPPLRLRPTHWLHPLARAAHLVAIGVHGHEAQQVVHVAAAAQAAHKLGPHALVPKHALVTGCCDQALHADGAVLRAGAQKGH